MGMGKRIPDEVCQIAYWLHEDEKLSWQRVARLTNGLLDTNWQPASLERAVARWKQED